jgi:hypothetical protein
MAEKQRNQIVVVEPITKTVNDLLEAIRDKDLAEISPFPNADEAVQYARQFVPCMLVLCIQTNNDIPPILNTLKKLKNDIKQGHVKTLLVSKIKNSQLQKLIGEFGVTDYIEEPITPRTLMFKANLQLKALDTTRRQIELKKQSEEKIVFKSTKKSEDDAQSTGNEIKTRNKPALQLANDTFLIKNSVVKKQAKKYLVELDGPDPATGDWVPEGTDPANPAWRWKPTDKEDEPGSEEGDGWVASGEKPQFKAAAKKWQLASEKPALFFKKKDQKVAEKIAVDADGEVIVAEDSPAAEENLRKNLKKAERQKKKKQAEAAGIPFVDDEAEQAPAVKAVAPVAEEEDADDESLEPAVRAERKTKREKKAVAAIGKPEVTQETVKAAKAQEIKETREITARQNLEKMQKASEERKKAAVASGLLPDPAKEEKPKAELKAIEEETKETSAPGPIPLNKKEKTAPAAKGEGQLLDFLKKKKEKVVKPAVQEEVADAAPEEEENDGAEGKAQGAIAKLKKRQREKKAKASLEDFADVLADKPIAEKPPTKEVIEEEEEAKLSAAIAEAEVAVNAELAGKLNQLKDRKRKRDSKKKALLEEIQAESEPTPEEIKKAEKKRMAKALGVEEEEEPEAERRNPRLEKLRKKRAELDELEREHEADEAKGLALHTQQADEARGMNVWDTDETAAPDESPAEKLLKKLKKERKEKAKADSKEMAEAKKPEDFVESSGSEAKEKKKKKKVGAATQADGLEDVFADEEEDAVSDDLYDQESKAEAREEETVSDSKNDRLDRLRKKRDAAKSESGNLAEESEKESNAEIEQEESEALDSESEENSTPEKKRRKNNESEDTESEDLSAEEKKEKKQKKESAYADSVSEKSAARGKGRDSGQEQEEATEETRSEKIAGIEKSSPKKFSEAESIDLSLPKKNSSSLPASAEEKLKKKGESSNSMKRFLERRLQKKEAPEHVRFSESLWQSAIPSALPLIRNC